MLHDNGPRADQTPEVLARLKPVFDRRHGTVTAANASQITDGAVALLVMTERKASELGLTPMGALTGYAYAGCDPKRMGLGPAFAIAKTCDQLGLDLEQADLIEINEAFAAQVLAVLKALKSEEFARKHLRRQRHVGKVEKDRLNVNGGSIALGHPVGASGARLILTSLKELARRGEKRALVSLCVGGGQGAAIWLERL
jgi:acetyl-CoA acetyltransferase family protein